MLRSPLAWVGGKSRLREKILERFPEHECYVEVFGGAAWVLFGKDPGTSKSEVLNDLDGELINFWRVIKHRPAEFAEMASWLLASRELWTEWKPLPSKGTEIERAIRFYAVIKLGFGAQRIPTSFGSKNRGRPTTAWPGMREDLGRITPRLRQVWIERLPWEHCIEKFDGAGSFFYLDPPFRCGGSKAYFHQFTDDDHQRLAASLLSRVRGSWLLSYNDDPFIERLYRHHRTTIEHLEVPYSIARQGRQRMRELLIRNY
jgi:DNA adenine methylase